MRLASTALGGKLRGDYIPDWLPPRPLLIGHLAAKDVLTSVSSLGQGVDPAEGWNYLVDALTAREARIDVGVDGATVRRILEQLATRARTSASGLGPVAFDAIVLAFHAVCSYYPDPEAFILLQRLPGLQVYEPGQNTRIFVDEDLADVLRAGEIVDFVSAPFAGQFDHLSGWKTLLGGLGMGVAVHRLDKMQVSFSGIDSALRQVLSRGERFQELAAELLRILLYDGNIVG